MSHELPLGQIIDDKQQRDAIHVAVAPVIAAETLYPAQHIGFVDDAKTRVGTGAESRIGIVDPFLREAVRPEQRFFMFLYPGTITSLRHDWTHPAFGSEAKQPFPSLDDPMDDILERQASERKQSEAWLRNFCLTNDCPGYEEVMDAVQGKFIDYEDYGGSYINNERLHFSGTDAHSDIPPEFWTHAEIVLGKKLQLKPKYFSCSC